MDTDSLADHPTGRMNEYAVTTSLNTTTYVLICTVCMTTMCTVGCVAPRLCTVGCVSPRLCSVRVCSPQAVYCEGV